VGSAHTRFARNLEQEYHADMINDDDATTRRALDNCDRVRRFRVKFLQVRPDPRFADNLYVRLGNGPWHYMHVHTAEAFARNALNRYRRTRKSRAAASMGRGDATGVRLPRR
jgi:hypothetical protein